MLVSSLSCRTGAERGENNEYAEDAFAIASEIWILSQYREACFSHYRSPFGVDMEAFA
jgi:hypothetical protein